MSESESIKAWKEWFAKNCSRWNTVEDIEREQGRTDALEKRVEAVERWLKQSHYFTASATETAMMITTRDERISELEGEITWMRGEIVTVMVNVRDQGEEDTIDQLVKINDHAWKVLEGK